MDPLSGDATATVDEPLVAIDRDPKPARFTCPKHPDWHGRAPQQWGSHVRDEHGGINPKTGKPLKKNGHKPQQNTAPRPPIAPDPEREAEVLTRDKALVEESYLTVIDSLRAEQDQLERIIMALEERHNKLKA